MKTKRNFKQFISLVLTVLMICSTMIVGTVSVNAALTNDDKGVFLVDNNGKSADWPDGNDCNTHLMVFNDTTQLWEHSYTATTNTQVKIYIKNRYDNGSGGVTQTQYVASSDATFDGSSDSATYDLVTGQWHTIAFTPTEGQKYKFTAPYGLETLTITKDNGSEEPTTEPTTTPTPSENWYVSGIFGVKGGNEISSWSRTATDLPMDDSDGDGIYTLDSKYTLSELSSKPWYIRFYNGTNIYASTADDDISLDEANANTKYGTKTVSDESGDKGWSFKDATGTSTGTVVLCLDTNQDPPQFYFTLNGGETPTEPPAGIYTLKDSTALNGTLSFSGTPDKGETITITANPVSSYYNAASVAVSYTDTTGATKAAAADKVGTNSFTYVIPDDASEETGKTTISFTATFELDKNAYIASKGDGLWIDVAPDKKDTTATLIKWNNYNGSTHSSTSSTYKFYVPKGTDLSNAVIYNAYASDVTLNSRTIPANGGNATVSLSKDGSYTTGGAVSYSVKVMQGSTDSMFLYTSDGKGNDYDLPTSTDNADNMMTVDADDKESVKASGGLCTTMSGTTVSDALILSQVKGRGNSSWEASAQLFGKYAFNMKLASATQLLGLPKSKSYCLLANNVDQAMLRNALTYDLAAQIGLYDSPEFKFVDIYDNGMYMGSYLVTEKVDVADKNKLIKGNSLDDIHDDIAKANGDTLLETTKTGSFTTTSTNHSISYKCGEVSNNISLYDKDYLDATFLLEFELGERVDDEASYFKSYKGQYVVVKSPEFATEQEVKFIAEKFDELETKVYSSSSTLADLSKYMDLDSFARMYLIQELSANLDTAATSYYLTYNVADGRFVASPVWDYDWAFGQHNGGGKYGLDENGNQFLLKDKLTDNGVKGWWARYKGIDSGSYYINKWNLQSQLANNTAFQSVIKKVWNGTSSEDGFYTILQEYTKSGGTIETWESQMADSVAMNETRWGFIASNPSSGWGTVSHGSTFAANVDYLQTDWTATRASWLDGEINNFADYEQISAPTLTAYDESGNEITAPVEPNTPVTLKATTSEIFVQYALYDNGVQVGDTNTTGEFTVYVSQGTHNYTVNTVYNDNSKTSNSVEVTAQGETPIGEQLTGLKVVFKGTNLTYLQPSLAIADADGNEVLAKTALTRGTRIGIHYEGSYAFDWWTTTLSVPLTVGEEYTFTFTTNGSKMQATVVPDLSKYSSGAEMYFAVDNLHTGTTAVDITYNATAKAECRSSVHMITNTESALALATVSLAANLSGTQTATTYTLGDVNRDAQLNIKDAAAIQLKLAKLSDAEETDSILGDFDINGTVNIKDSAAVQLALAKLY